jgi:O-antigen ligase
MYMQYLLALTVWIAPMYAVRFNLFGLPANVLMLWLFFLWLCFALWLILGQKVRDFLGWMRSECASKSTLLLAAFFLAGVISLFVGGLSQEKLGQFIVLFLQPIGTYFIFRYLLSLDTIASGIRKWFFWSSLHFVAAAGLYAVIQYTTLLGVPQAWWGNSQEPKRAVAFFLHPNFYALFITPLLAFLLPTLGYKLQVIGESIKKSLHSPLSTLYPLVAWVLGAVGLLLSLSRGGWFGLAVAAGAYLLVAGNRTLIKSATIITILAVIVVFAVPNFRYRLLLPFRGEKSSVARVSLWHTGWKMVKDSPIVGKGILGFSNNWYAYNTDLGLQHYPAPHNIFLNFWVDTGLLGLVSFLGLMVLAVVRGVSNRADVYRRGLALACVALFVHGLIDIPYFKNDLALLFWMLYSFI